MSTRVDVEDIEITRGERVLAVMLAVFLLVGFLWAYFELNLADDPRPYRDPVTQLSAADRAAQARVEPTARSRNAARRRAEDRRRALVDRREAYRTALEEGRRDPELEQAYRLAQSSYDAALDLLRRRTAEAAAARSAAGPIYAKVTRLERERQREDEAAQRRAELLTAGLRLALVLGLAAAALYLMAWQRRRRSRWVVVGYAGVGVAAVLALVMGVDYLTEWFDPLDLGPLVLSLVGTAFTLIAVAALQRQIGRRLPGLRVRRGACPFCGYPAGRGDHCEGCGRDVVAPCARCTEPRRVGTAHCAACGQA